MRTLIALAAALALPAPAAAATLTEVPPLALRGGLFNDCQQVTGLPGEFALQSGAAVRLVHATRTGFTLGQQVRFPPGFECRAIAGSPSGAGVIVAESSDDGVMVAVREPGGAWGTPQAIFADQQESTDSTQAAVSDRGDVIVVQQVSELNETHLRVVRRAPGAAFSAPETITTPRVEQLVTPAIAATGEAFLMSYRVIRSRPPIHAPISIRIAPPGAPFGAPADVADGRWLSAPALAVAADGRALIAAAQGDSLVIAERAPGAAFGPTTAVAPTRGTAVAADVAIAANGAAAVAWQRVFEGDAVVVTRSAAGLFSAPVTALEGEPPVPASYDPFYFSEAFYASLGPLSDVTFERGGDALALTGDGRAALATTIDSAPGERLAGVAALATLPLGAGTATASTAGSQTAAYLETGSPIILPDGSPAVIWIEDVPGSARIRLHLAAEGIVERPDPPTPRVTVGVPRKRTLGPSDSLVLPITCSAACEVRASLDALDAGTEMVRLSEAGTRRLEVRNVAQLLRPRSRPVRIHLTYGAPGALHPRERTLTVRLRTTVRPLRTVDVKARRVGDTVRVTWRTTRPADPLTYFFVTGDATRALTGNPLVTKALESEGDSRRSFSVTLRNARAVRWVTVRAPVDFSPGARTTVKVTG